MFFFKDLKKETGISLLFSQRFKGKAKILCDVFTYYTVFFFWYNQKEFMINTCLGPFLVFCSTLNGTYNRKKKMYNTPNIFLFVSMYNTPES